MRLLLVEDDLGIQEMVREGLSEDGITVEVCSTSEQTMQRTIKPDGDFDFFLLDIMLPGLSGVDLCHWLRFQGHKQPIMLLTAKDSTEDKIRGLDAGADDYLTKPFQMVELRARIRALLRMVNGYPRENLAVEDLVLDPNTGRICRGLVELSLSRKETALLEYFMRNHGRILTRTMIADSVWGAETSQFTNVIDVFINHLRNALQQPGRPDLLHNVRGKGFRLCALNEQEKG